MKAKVREFVLKMGPRGRLRSTGGGGGRGLLAAFVTLAVIGTATEGNTAKLI